jgi:rubredoxin
MGVELERKGSFSMHGAARFITGVGAVLIRRAFLLIAAGGLLWATGRGAGAATTNDPRLDVLWRCLGSECPGYTYDPRRGEEIYDNPPLTPFEELPEDWRCPKCGAGKAEFHGFPR